MQRRRSSCCACHASWSCTCAASRTATRALPSCTSRCSSHSSSGAFTPYLNSLVYICFEILPLEDVLCTACCCFGSNSGVQLLRLIQLLCSTISRCNGQVLGQNLLTVWSAIYCRLRNRVLNGLQSIEPLLPAS